MMTFEQPFNLKYGNTETIEKTIRFELQGTEDFIEKQFHIPLKWIETAFLAIDRDGEVTIFQNEPKAHKPSKSWDCGSIEDNFIVIGEISNIGFIPNWENSLIRISEMELNTTFIIQRI